MYRLSMGSIIVKHSGACLYHRISLADFLMYMFCCKNSLEMRYSENSQRSYEQWLSELTDLLEEYPFLENRKSVESVQCLFELDI